MYFKTGGPLVQRTAVYDDAQSSIKTSGLVGDKYLKIDPGGSGVVLKQERLSHRGK